MSLNVNRMKTNATEDMCVVYVINILSIKLIWNDTNRYIRGKSGSAIYNAVDDSPISTIWNDISEIFTMLRTQNDVATPIYDFMNLIRNQNRTRFYVKYVINTTKIEIKSSLTHTKPKLCFHMRSFETDF